MFKNNLTCVPSSNDVTVLGKKLSYNLRKGPILNLRRTQSIFCGTNILEVLLCGTIFLLKLNPAI